LKRQIAINYGAHYTVFFLLLFDVFFYALTALVSLDLLLAEVSRSHSDTPHSVELLRTSVRPVAETSTWQHTALTRDRHPRCRRDSNPLSQPANDRRTTP